MKRNRFKIHVQRSRDDSVTKLRICGLVMTPLPPGWLRSLASLLARYSGESVELVLPVDAGTDAWFVSWCDAISETQGHHLHVRFAVEDKPHLRGGSYGAR